VTSFGLALQIFIPELSFQFNQLLGVGGFATVVQVTSATKIVMACKWLRHADVSVLQHERHVLDELAKIYVPFVPRVCSSEGENGIIKNVDGSLHGLLMMPVGKPCNEALIACSNRIFFSVQVLEHVWKTLQAAHSAQYTHSDVRPSNIIQTDSEKSPVFILIDWGLSQRLDKSYRKQDIHGVPAFMSNRRLDLLFSNTTRDWKPEANDDLEAAVLTFFALAVSLDGRAPWQDSALSVRDLATTRTKWIADNEQNLRLAASQINDPSAKSSVTTFINSAVET
jgi:serine/threonine protein kinase